MARTCMHGHYTPGAHVWRTRYDFVSYVLPSTWNKLCGGGGIGTLGSKSALALCVQPSPLATSIALCVYVRLRAFTTDKEMP